MRCLRPSIEKTLRPGLIVLSIWRPIRTPHKHSRPDYYALVNGALLR